MLRSTTKSQYLFYLFANEKKSTFQINALPLNCFVDLWRNIRRWKGHRNIFWQNTLSSCHVSFQISFFLLLSNEIRFAEQNQNFFFHTAETWLNSQATLIRLVKTQKSVVIFANIFNIFVSCKTLAKQIINKIKILNKNGIFYRLYLLHICLLEFFKNVFHFFASSAKALRSSRITTSCGRNGHCNGAEKHSW